MTLDLFHVALISLVYAGILFGVAGIAHYLKGKGKSVTGNPLVYALSIAVYCTSWTFYGSVGKAATTGIDYLMIYLGPSLMAFSWLFLLKRIVRISKEHNITSIADFISLRYGKSLWLGALVTLIAIFGIMPYIALQIKAVSTSFYLISGISPETILSAPDSVGMDMKIPSGFILALILSTFSVIFGARRLMSSERHEGLMAAVAFESVVKLTSLLVVGIFVTYVLYDGIGDIFSRFAELRPDSFDRLFTMPEHGTQSIPPFTMLFLSMGAIMLLPRQFHVMVIENSNERHIPYAMWLFPAYLFLINLFILPIALGGILTTGDAANADFFVISLPLAAGRSDIALIAFIGGLSAAAGMVMVESVAISTMLLNHIFMPVIVRFNPRPWFPDLLINLKRLGIFLVVFLGYFYYRAIGDSFMLVNMGMISFSAAAQFMPAMLGALYWRRGNRAGAITGTLLGFITWSYTLLLPSFIMSGWLPSSIMENGLLGITLLKPTELFGLSGMDMWSHSLFWSMLFNISGYLSLSILISQDEMERDQVKKFIHKQDHLTYHHAAETKRLSKPVTISQLTALMAKFIGQKEADAAMKGYLSGKSMDSETLVPEFELPKIKRFTEKTLAGSVGAAAAGAIVESFLSDLGSKMESVYDIFNNVRTSLDQSREALYVRLKASEIINRTLDLQIIMDDLLLLLIKEFRFDSAFIQLRDVEGKLSVYSYQGSNRRPVSEKHWYSESRPYIEMALQDGKPHFVNDTGMVNGAVNIEKTTNEGICSFAHIPIIREGETPLGVISVFSRAITGLFTEEFVTLLSSLAGQLAQAVLIVREIEAREQERRQKEKAQLQNARVLRDMEIAQQIQLSLLPEHPPEIPGIKMVGRCISAAHVGGDYYDFFKRDEHSMDFLIADVSGHSVGAALIMAEVRTLLRAQSGTAYSSSSILQSLNVQLFDDLTNAELFITMFFARYNSATGRLSYSNAGHNPPLIYRPSDGTFQSLDSEGLILGVKRSVIFEERTTELHRGDILFLYTDGIPEACSPDDDFFGIERIKSHLVAVSHESPGDIIESFYRKIAEFTGIETLQDDITMVVIKLD